MVTARPPSSVAALAPALAVLLLATSLSACSPSQPRATDQPNGQLSPPHSAEPIQLPSDRNLSPAPTALSLAELTHLTSKLQFEGARAQFCLASAGLQIWLASERVGKEPTSDAPAQIEARALTQKMEEHWEALTTQVSVSFVTELRSPFGGAAVNHRLDRDKLLIKCRRYAPDLQEKLREIYAVGAQARRLQLIANNPESFLRETVDFRPWLRLDRRKLELQELAMQWNSTTAESPQGKEWLNLVAEACPISLARAEECAIAVNAVQDVSSAKRLFETVWSGGRFRFLGKFGVQVSHRGIRVERREQGIKLVLRTLGVGPQDLMWMKEEVRTQWSGQVSMRGNQQTVLGVDFEPLEGEMGGDALIDLVTPLRLSWQPGAIAHADRYGGTEITLDSALDYTQELLKATFAHELGHVLGFVDCYVEYFAPDTASVVYYSLDVSDRMCALSGHKKPTHLQSLVSAYVN